MEEKQIYIAPEIELISFVPREQISSTEMDDPFLDTMSLFGAENGIMPIAASIGGGGTFPGGGDGGDIYEDPTLPPDMGPGIE